MKKLISILMMSIIFLVLTGCGVMRNVDSEVKTDFYIIESGQIRYYDDVQFINDIPDFENILYKTIRSLNEIKDDVKDIDFILDIASDNLREQRKFKDLTNQNLLGDFKKVNEEILDYKITGIIYDLDKDIIKLYIYIETYHKHEEPTKQLITVCNNQTYKYKVDKTGIFLMDYDLELYIK